MRHALLTAAFSASAFAASGALYNITSANHTCILQPEYLSCSTKANNASSVDTCCTETYGGLLLQTQYWDVYADKALPKNTWTMCVYQRSFVVLRL